MVAKRKCYKFCNRAGSLSKVLFFCLKIPMFPRSHTRTVTCLQSSSVSPAIFETHTSLQETASDR